MNLKLTTGRDLDFTNGQLQLVSGIAEIAQKLSVRYRFYKGEWLLDERIGTPYYQRILGKQGVSDQDVARAYLMRVALTCPGITNLDEFDLEIDTSLRKMSIDLVAITIAGEVLKFTEEFVI